MGTFMPSEIARLVLGYLEEQNCTSAYDEFLNASPYLDECRGRNFTTVLMGYSLTDILEDYCSTQAHLLSCKPDELRKELRRYRTLLDKVKILTENVHIQKLLNNCTVALSNSTKNSMLTNVESSIKKEVQKTNNSKMCSGCNMVSANCACKQSLQPILPNLFATPFKLDPTQAAELSALPIESLVETTRLCDLPGTDNVQQKATNKPVKSGTSVENIQSRVEDDLHITDLTEKDMDISSTTKDKRQSDQTKSSQDLSFDLSVKTNELLNSSEKQFWGGNGNSETDNKINKEKAIVKNPVSGSEQIEDVDNKQQNSKEDCVKKKENRSDCSFDEFASGVTGTARRKSSTLGDTTSTPELDVNSQQKKSKISNKKEVSLTSVDAHNSPNLIKDSATTNVKIGGDISNPPHCEIFENPFIARESSINYVKPSLKVDVNPKIYSVNVSQTTNTNSLYVLCQGPNSSSQLHQSSESSSQLLPYLSTVLSQDPKPSCSWQSCIDVQQDRLRENDRNVIILSNDIVDTNILKNERKLVINKRLDSKPDRNKIGVDNMVNQMMGSGVMYSTAPTGGTHSATNTDYANVSYAQTVPITVPVSMRNITAVKQNSLISQEIEVAPRNIVSGKVPDVFISNGVMQIAPMTRSSGQSKIYSEADIMSMPTVIMLNPAENPVMSTDQVNVPMLSLPENSEITILDDVITEKKIENMTGQKTESKVWQNIAPTYNVDITSNNKDNEKGGILQASCKSKSDMECSATPQNATQNRKPLSTPRRQHPHVRVLDFKSPPRQTSDRENVMMSVDETKSQIEVEKLKTGYKENKVRTKLSTQYEERTLSEKVTHDSCDTKINMSKNQFIPSIDDSKLQVGLKKTWNEGESKKNSWDQDLRALIAKQPEEDSYRKMKIKRTKKPKSKKNMKGKTLKKGVSKSTEDSSLDNSLEKNGKLLEEILELDNEKKPQHKSEHVVIADAKQVKCKRINKKQGTIKHKTSEKKQECNKTNIIKEVILDNSIAAMKVDIIKPILKVKAQQTSFKCVMKNELENEPPVPSNHITPEMPKEDISNPVNAKCNLASLLETPLKMSMLDIPMQTPRFVSPGQIFDPTSDIKILTIPTPNFLNSPKTTLVNKMASNSKLISPYSRPTDYSSGSSYYKPDESECTIDFSDLQPDAKDPLILTEKDYEEQLKPSSEESVEKLFNCQNIIQEAKTIRPRRQCTLKVQCYNENIHFSKPVLEVNKTNKGVTEKSVKKDIKKKINKKKERTDNNSSFERSLITSSNDSLLVEEVESEKLEKVLPEGFDTACSTIQTNSLMSLQVDIEQETELSLNEIDIALSNSVKKQTKLSVKKREMKMIPTKSSKSKMRDTKSLLSRSQIKPVPAPKISCRHIPKIICSSCDHPDLKPLPTKSRRKSSTPRKLEALSFKEESNHPEISELPVLNKFIQNEHINAEEELPSLHFSSDEADTIIENVSEESEKRDDPFISEIREYIKSSDKNNVSTLIDCPTKNSYDPETAKLIERDLLGSPYSRKEHLVSSPELQTDQQSDKGVKDVECTLESPILASSNDQSMPSNVNVKVSVSDIGEKGSVDVQEVNDIASLNNLDNGTTTDECDSTKDVIKENKSLSINETGVCDTIPPDILQSENVETVVEWSISESNTDTEFFFKICDLSIRDRSTLYRPHVDMDSFHMDICVFNTETEDEEDRKLSISPMVNLFTINPKRDYSRSKQNVKNKTLCKTNELKTSSYNRESEFFKEINEKSPDPNKELYDQSETALAVRSIMGMDKLYTPNKNRSTLSKRCLELFGETASNISSPDKDEVQRDVDVEVHKELDRGELEDGEYVSENDSETCLGEFDSLKDHRKRKIESESDESEPGVKKSKDMHAPHILLKEFDIECILSKLHGPK